MRQNLHKALEAFCLPHGTSIVQYENGWYFETVPETLMVNGGWQRVQ